MLYVKSTLNLNLSMILTGERPSADKTLANTLFLWLLQRQPYITDQRRENQLILLPGQASHGFHLLASDISIMY